MYICIYKYVELESMHDDKKKKNNYILSLYCVSTLSDKLLEIPEGRR